VFCSLCRKSHVQSWLLWMLNNLAVVLSYCSTNHVYIRLSCKKYFTLFLFNCRICRKFVFLYIFHFQSSIHIIHHFLADQTNQCYLITYTKKTKKFVSFDDFFFVIS
jgi:hypothetical protein